MLTAIVVAKAVLEVALLALLGQGLLYALAGEKRESNLFYQVLRTVASPVMAVTRLLTPKTFPPLWVGLVAFSMLVAAWLVATYYKICLTLGTC